MATMHTAAPWTDDEAGFLGADGRPVGVPKPGIPLLDEVARVRADRRLMREAPMLLEALERLRGFAAQYASPSALEAAAGLFAEVDGVIARVKGGDHA